MREGVLFEGNVMQPVRFTLRLRPALQRFEKIKSAAKTELCDSKAVDNAFRGLVSLMPALRYSVAIQKQVTAFGLCAFGGMIGIVEIQRIGQASVEPGQLCIGYDQSSSLFGGLTCGRIAV